MPGCVTREHGSDFAAALLWMVLSRVERNFFQILDHSQASNLSGVVRVNTLRDNDTARQFSLVSDS